MHYGNFDQIKILSFNFNKSNAPSKNIEQNIFYRIGSKFEKYWQAKRRISGKKALNVTKVDDPIFSVVENV